MAGGARSSIVLLGDRQGEAGERRDRAAERACLRHLARPWTLTVLQIPLVGTAGRDRRLRELAEDLEEQVAVLGLRDLLEERPVLVAQVRDDLRRRDPSALDRRMRFDLRLHGSRVVPRE